MSRESIAEQLKALLAWRNRPAGIAEDEQPDEILPLRTNFTTVVANDNNPEDTEDMGVERRIQILPTIAGIMRQVKDGETERNDKGQIIGIGKLRFSDGTQTERAYKLTIDGGAEVYQARVPTGGMLGTSEASTRMLGGDEDPSAVTSSNHYYADMFDVKAPAHRSNSKRTKGKSFTATESREELAKAYANTDMSKVTYTRYPSALPAAGSKIGDNFLGMKKGKTGESGSMSWTDISTALVEREIWSASIAYLPKGDLEALDKAMNAKNFKGLGMSLGYGAEYSRRKGGRKAIMSANDNLANALKEAS